MFHTPSQRRGWSRRLIAAALAYLLAVQGVIVGVGLGMSGAAAVNQIDFVICSPVAGDATEAPPAGDDPQQNGHRPQCPFCFIAAHGGGVLATVGEPAAVPADVARDVAALRFGFGANRNFASLLFRSNGNPRAPPQFFV